MTLNHVTNITPIRRFINTTNSPSLISPMGSSHDRDVVLIDSDSDTELQHVSKRHKPDSDAPMAPFRKPFMQDSDSDRQESESGRPLSEPPTLAVEGEVSGFGDSESESESEDEAGNAQSVGDDQSITNGQNHQVSDGHHGLLPLTNSSVDSSDLDEIAGGDIANSANEDDKASSVAMQRTIYETRKYLKTRGIMAFLQEYLPATALSENILELIVKLGFVPRNIPPLAQGENLLQLIKLLHLAMKRVRQLRARLDDFYTVDHVLDKLRSAKKILVITGAGISTSLGIPDFRSSKGFYSRISNLGLSDPQEVFDLDIFHTDPSIFYSIAYLILPPDNVYAPLHKFIKLLQDKGKLLRNYTQNIDNLEANAGIEYTKMIQCHGSFAFATCVTCGYQVKGEEIYPQMRNKEIPYCPKCAAQRKRMMNKEDTYVEESYGVMKPNITFFGEALPSLFHDNINHDLRETDLIISIGTSLKVAPVAEIVDKVPLDVPQVLINKDPIHHCNFDVSLLGYCDDVVSYLCDRLGADWDIDHSDYKKLVGDGSNLELETTKEKGVYNIRNLEREAELASMPPTVLEEPDLIVLEPTLN